VIKANVRTVTRARNFREYFVSVADRCRQRWAVLCTGQEFRSRRK